MTAITKLCTTCKVTHPFEMFTKSKRSLDGRVSQCRSCRSAYLAERRKDPLIRAKEVEYSANWYQANKEKVLEKTTAWRLANQDKARASVNKYAAKNRDAKRAADNKRYWKDIEISRAKGREKYAKNPVARKDSVRKWRSENKDAVRAWGRAWTQLNKEKYATRAEHRRKLKEFMDDFDKFVMQEAAKLCELRRSTTGFNWQIDHVIPLSKGGTHEAKNLQVVPAAWNAAKRDYHCEKYFG